MAAAQAGKGAPMLTVFGADPAALRRLSSVGARSKNQTPLWHKDFSQLWGNSAQSMRCGFQRGLGPALFGHQSSTSQPEAGAGSAPTAARRTTGQPWSSM